MRCPPKTIATHILTKMAAYQRPYTLDELKQYYPDRAGALADDPVHRWRAVTGIELIHKEPTKREQLRIWDNWQKMPGYMRKLSDAESQRLFGKDNASRHTEIMLKYWS